MQVIHKSPDQANLVPHAELVSKTKFELLMLMEQRFLIGSVLWLGLEIGRRKQGNICGDQYVLGALLGYFS